MASIQISDECNICTHKFLPGQRVVVVRAATLTDATGPSHGRGNEIRPDHLRVLYSSKDDPNMGICTECWEELARALNTRRGSHGYT